MDERIDVVGGILWYQQENQLKGNTFTKSKICLVHHNENSFQMIHLETRYEAKIATLPLGFG